MGGGGTHMINTLIVAHIYKNKLQNIEGYVIRYVVVAKVNGL